MKKCSVCKQEKDFLQFNKNKAKKDGLQSHCRGCSHERFKTYWENNKDKQRTVVRQRNIQVIAAARKIMFDHLSTHPCIDCGNSDIRVLEFDHVSGEKLNGVGALAGSGYRAQVILDEITKCVVRCRNCHAIETYKRMGGSWHDQYFGSLV